MSPTSSQSMPKPKAPALAAFQGRSGNPVQAFGSAEVLLLSQIPGCTICAHVETISVLMQLQCLMVRGARLIAGACAEQLLPANDN